MANLKFVIVCDFEDVNTLLTCIKLQQFAHSNSGEKLTDYQMQLLDKAKDAVLNFKTINENKLSKMGL